MWSWTLPQTLIELNHCQNLLGSLSHTLQCVHLWWGMWAETRSQDVWAASHLPVGSKYFHELYFTWTFLSCLDNHQSWGGGKGGAMSNLLEYIQAFPRFPILLLNWILSLINDSVRACRVLIVCSSSLCPSPLSSQRLVFCSSSWSLISVPLTEMGSTSNLCSSRALRTWCHLPGMLS